MSSYYTLARTRDRLEKLVQIACVAPFEQVRQAYLMLSVDYDPHQKTHEAPEYETIAEQFTHAMSSVVLKVHSSQFNDNLSQKWKLEVAEILKQSGSPYERVGRVLSWFKETRKVLRNSSSLSPSKKRFDTENSLLQEHLTKMLESLCHRLVADSPHVPEQEWRQWIQKSDREPRISSGINMHSDRAKRAALKRSRKLRQSIGDAPAWAILMDWRWRRGCYADACAAHLKSSAPPSYILTQYLLRASAESFKREHVVQALIMEKVHYNKREHILESGSDLGLQCASLMPDYEQWWTSETKKAARDWRLIRRNEALQPRVSIYTINNITLGDTVARLRRFGPQEVVKGVLSHCDTQTKSLLLDRLQPGLGQTYAALSAVEQSLGPMSDVIIKSLNDKLQGATQPSFNLPTMDLF